MHPFLFILFIMKNLNLFLFGLFFLCHSVFANAISHQQAFFTQLKGPTQSVNETILKERKSIQNLYAVWLNSKTLSSKDREVLEKLSHSYGLKKLGFKQNRDWQALLNRVDIVPLSLVLAQAANESGWGNSRFAKQGNNYFGQWCYQKGCGLVPKKRARGAHHEVKKFPSINASIASYIHNLNTHPSYQLLRDIRATERKQHKTLDGLSLAMGLKHYSERGEAYVRNIQAMIRRYHLTSLTA